MWEETLGNSQIQDGSSGGINKDIPFECKDPDNPTVAEMEVQFAPLNLTKFPGYSYRLAHELWKPFSDQNENYVEDLVAKFLLLFLKEVDLEECIYMRLFALHLERKGRIWFTNLPKAKIPSLP